MRRLFYRLLICMLTGAALPAGAQTLPLDAVLKHSLAAYGGETRLAQLTSRRELGRITVRGQPQPGRIERSFQVPDRLSNVIAYGSGPAERRLLIRDKAWRNGQPASVPEHLAMSLQLARLRLPLLLAENRGSLADLGERSQNGRSYRAISLEVAEGVTLSVLIDTQSGLILQTVGKLSLADGTNADFTTLYGDFRSVDGFVVAMREDHYSQGAHTGTTQFEQAEVNRPLPSGTFTP